MIVRAFWSSCAEPVAKLTAAAFEDGRRIQDDEIAHFEFSASQHTHRFG